MEATLKALTREEKRTIINFTLDNLALSAFKGALAGGALALIFRRKILGIFTLGYFMGVSLRESNYYIVSNYKNQL
jgi:hypothetical protein